MPCGARDIGNARKNAGVGSKYKWIMCSAVFFLLSTGQLYNHGYFISGFTDIVPARMYTEYHAKVVWTVIPVIFCTIALVPPRNVMRFGVLLGLLLIILSFGRDEYFEKYYILSGFSSYLCFYLFTGFGAGTNAR